MPGESPHAERLDRAIARAIARYRTRRECYARARERARADGRPSEYLFYYAAEAAVKHRKQPRDYLISAREWTIDCLLVAALIVIWDHLPLS